MRLLNVNGRCILRTEDGCDIDNDEGLSYAVAERQKVIFHECEGGSDEGVATQDSSSDLKAWPLLYTLPALPEQLRKQIRECGTQEDAIRLKCNVNFTSSFVGVLANDFHKYTGEEM